MTCDEIQGLLSAFLDGEPEGAPVEAHLAACEGCRAVFESMKADHVALQAALSPLGAAAGRAADEFSRGFRVPRARAAWPLAMAAGVVGFVAGALALSLLREPPETGAVRQELAEVRSRFEKLAGDYESYKRGGLGRLTYLLGSLEISEGGAWGPAYIGMPLPPGAAVRTTPGSKAAFHMADGSEVRMNESTEISFDGGRDVRLASGEAWARVKPGDRPFEVKTRDGRVDVLGTEIGVRVEARYTVLLVFEGLARIANARGQREVKAGQGAVVDKDVINASTVTQMERATRWMLDLLVARGRDNPELNTQIAKLFQMMGEAKVEYMTEEEIKSYGSTCTIPIARYLESPECAARPDVRKKAVRILSEIGDWYAVDAYLKLLEDADASVRQLAARGLQRVTGQDFGRDAQFWGVGPADQRAAAAKQWRDWWTRTRSSKVTDDLEKQLDRVKKKMERDR